MYLSQNIKFCFSVNIKIPFNEICLNMYDETQEPKT
jgi:hypothetical protein